MTSCIDFLNPWIKNKQLVQQIDANDWETVQHDVIENVFNGFESMLNVLLKDRFTLTISQQNTLYNTLINYATNSGDIFENYRKEQTVSISSISDDCLSYIMRFLTPKNRHIMQQCCRLFAVTIRQESSVNDIASEFPLMNMLPFRNTIIDGIQSNDNTENKKALKLFSKCLELNTESIYNPLKFIKCYSDDIYNKLKKLILNDRSELAPNIAQHIFKQNFDPDMVPLMLKKNLLSLPEMINLIQTNKESLQLVGLMAIRRLLGVERNGAPAAAQVTETDAIPKIVQFLFMEHGENGSQKSVRNQCIFEAAWVVINIAASTAESVLCVVDHGAIEGFVYLLRNAHDPELINQAIWGLSNIAGGDKTLTHRILSTHILSDIVPIIPNSNSKIQKNGIWFISNLLRSSDTSSYEVISSHVIDIVPMVTNLLAITQDEDIIVHCLWTLQYLSNINDKAIECLCQNDVINICIKFLQEEIVKFWSPTTTTKEAILDMNDNICRPCLGVFGSLISGDDRFTQLVLDAGYLDVTEPFTYHLSTARRREILWSISNILVGSKKQIEAVLSRQSLIKRIVNIACFEMKWIVRKEALWCIVHVMKYGSIQQKKELGEYGAIEALCAMLTPSNLVSDQDLELILEGMELFLDVYSKCFADKIEACFGLDYLKQRCSDVNISEDALDSIVDFMNTYWPTDDDKFD